MREAACICLYMWVQFSIKHINLFLHLFAFAALAKWLHWWFPRHDNPCLQSSVYFKFLFYGRRQIISAYLKEPHKPPAGPSGGTIPWPGRPVAALREQSHSRTAQTQGTVLRWEGKKNTRPCFKRKRLLSKNGQGATEPGVSKRCRRKPVPKSSDYTKVKWFRHFLPPQLNTE